MASSNDARALHDLLEVVGRAEQRAPRQAWEDALGADFGSIEFARRYAEVLHLYTGAMSHVASLPDRARGRFEKYAWQWWASIVAPDHAWSNAVAMQTAVEPNALDQLGSLADLVEARTARPSSVGVSLTSLRDVCQEWIEAVLSEADLPEPLRLNLLQDLHHILWLIDNETLFGVERVTAAGTQVIGKVVTVGEALPPAKHGVWIARGKKLVGAVAMVGALHQGIDTSTALAEGASSFVAELTAGSTRVPLAPPPEIEPLSDAAEDPDAEAVT